MSKKKPNIAIIGTGISGLTCAHALKEHATITLFEKARGVGGRLATRRAEPFFFDHGAQYFKAKTPQFQQFIQPMIDDHIIAPWICRFAEFKGPDCRHHHEWDLDFPHYVGVPGMNAVAKYLAKPFKVHLSTRIQSIHQKETLWQLESESGLITPLFDWVIVTAPIEQSKALMPVSFQYHSELNHYTMQACFSLMLGLEAPLDLSFDCALVQDADISWISVNSHKPGRNGGYSLLVHSTNNWADQHIDDPKDSVINHLCNETNRILGQSIDHAVHKVVHGWRYANCPKQASPSVWVDTTQKLAACGDWCRHGRVEAAFLSALDTASAIQAIL